VKPTITASVTADILALHRWNHQTLRELKFAKARRVESQQAIRDLCEREGISLRAFSRYARNVYKGQR
jgi:hypothetical protein